MFVASSAVVLFLVLARTWRAAWLSLAVGAGTLALSSFWWMRVVALFGWKTLEAPVFGSERAYSPFAGLANLLSLNLTDEARFYPLGLALALAGLFMLIVMRRWPIPVWFLSVWILNPRGSIDRAVIVVALLVGVGFDLMLLPLVRHGEMWPGGLQVRPASRRLSGRVTSVTALMLVGALVSCVSWEASKITALTPPERAAMTWAARHTPVSSRFLVVTDSYWAADDVAEWFPVLSGRTSVATVQGSEWIPGRFVQRYDNAGKLQGCSSRSASCVGRWMTATKSFANYVFVAKQKPWWPAVGGEPVSSGCCAPLRASLDRSPAYRRAFDNAGAEIYVRR
jgi:hypothetical protein